MKVFDFKAPRMSFVLSVAAMVLVACSPKYDVVVIGGGAGGTAAAVEAARNGARTLVVEETQWLGGVLTSAGVSAIDGNYNLRGGIFGEFTDSLAMRYGGYGRLGSGWVSNILFNPKIGAQILDNMTRESGADILFETVATKIRRRSGNFPWRIRLSNGSRIRSCVLVDGTELGDVAEAAGAASLDDSRAVQDFTYVAIVKDFGHEIPMEKPDGYDIDNYRDCCQNRLARDIEGNNSKGQKLWSPAQMLSYGRLPDGYMMLNWPICGNDFYADYIDMSQEERRRIYGQAKLRTLGYIYFLQHELGFTGIGIADDVFPTEDGLPFYPYFREARRIAGRDTMTIDAARHPYDTDRYTRAVAVGDYPVDHHHYANPDWKNLSHLGLGSIPSFSIPVGVLIPVSVEDLLVADKAVSVDWEMNGAVRLQPVLLGLGQAAGALAAIAARSGRHPSEVPASEVQSVLLDHGCYLMPFLDLKPSDPGFRDLQEKGVRGEVHGTGRTVGWANETWVRIPGQ